jgi:hypothetical protein
MNPKLTMRTKSSILYKSGSLYPLIKMLGVSLIRTIKQSPILENFR